MKDEPEFREDGPRVIASVMSLQEALQEEDNSLHTAILEFYEKMAEVLGQELWPYLPRIVPVVLRSLDLDVSLQILDTEASSEKKGKFTSATIDLKLFGGVKNIVMNTSAL